MLKLSQSQLTAIENACDKAFIVRMEKFIETNFPELAVEDTITEFIESTINIANGYNITQEKDICDFISLCCVLGKDFCIGDQYPWAVDIVNHSSVLDGSNRVSMLLSAANQHLEDD